MCHRARASFILPFPFLSLSAYLLHFFIHLNFDFLLSQIFVFFVQCRTDPHGTSLLLPGTHERRFHIAEGDLYVQKNNITVISNVYVTLLFFIQCVFDLFLLATMTRFFLPQFPQFPQFSHFSHFYFQRILCCALCSTTLCVL